MSPAGSIDTRGDRVLVRVSGQFASVDDIRNVPITAGGRTIKLGDFTTITRGFEDPPTYTVRHNGQQVLMLGIVMTDDGNIVDLGKAIESAVAKIQAELPYGVELERVADQPTTVSESIWEFERSLLEALASCSREPAQPRLAHGHRRRALRAARARRRRDRDARDGLEPRAHLARLADHRARPARRRRHHRRGDDGREDGAGLGPGQGGGLLLLGDRDAAADRRADHRRRASCRSASRNRSTGEYAGGIFWIVGTAVLFSWIVSGLFTPYLAVKMLPKDFGKHHHGGDPYDTPFYRKLRGLIDLAIERRWWVIGATAAALALALPAMKLVPQQFFPASTRPELIVELRLKEGASFAATTEQVKKMEAVLTKDEDVKFFTAYTGAGAPRFYLSLNPELPNPGYAAVRRDDQGHRSARAACARA